jgi:hypothetical protein
MSYIVIYASIIFQACLELILNKLVWRMARPDMDVNDIM